VILVAQGDDDVTTDTQVATVLSKIDQVVAAQPRMLAVRGSDAVLSYGELSARADLLARMLRHLGVRPGDLVGQCVERSASLVVAALAIVRAGAAYVALDPMYPAERVQWMLDDSGATAVVSDASTAARLSTFGDRPVVVVADGGELPGGSATDSDELGPRPIVSKDVAYVVYTSGSTGRPKGVLVEHAGLMNLVKWHRTAFGLHAGDRCTQISSPGFDAVVWEIWPSLAAGASIHIVPESVRTDPLGLRDWLVTQGITVTFVPTAVADGIIGLGWPDDSALRYLLTGGDALTRRPRPDLGFTVVNNYGLSETTVVATSGAVAPDGDGAPSIGRPIGGVVAEVVDERLQPVDPGGDGELVLGGVAVARGYLNRPELTAERFLEGPRMRRYRTGDRVRVRADGEIEFLGRVDDQVSIRGFRVEPGEIAAALNSHPAIEASVVVGVGRSSSERRLVAYLVATDGERPESDELARFLDGSLPDYMVPSSFIWLKQFPLTEHGKIDRHALPAPGEVAGNGSTARRPGTRVEAATASVVAELLDVKEIRMTENFFLLGGHSMLGAQLIVRLNDMFGVEISLKYLFDHPTPVEIAAEVERQMAADQVDGMVIT
jgi:amino acid adenylation domain-containing protein